MRWRAGIRGRMRQGDTPNWRPLLDLAPAHVDDFMWMYEVETEQDARIQAYKHSWTRRYLHLDGQGRAFVYGDDGRYCEVDACCLLERVLAGASPR